MHFTIKTSWLLWALAIIYVLVILWGTNRGFDFVDEGYYLLGYSKNQEIGLTDTQFHIITRTLFGWTNLDIITVRYIRLFLGILGSVLLSWSISLFLQSRKSTKENVLMNFTNILPLILIGTLVPYGAGIQSLSYNSWNMFFVFSSSSMIFIYLSKIKDKYKVLSLFLLGLIVVFQFFTKFTSAVSQTVFVSFILLLTNRKDLKTLLKYTSAVVLGLIAGFLIYHTYFGNVFYAIRGILFSANVFMHSIYSGYTTTSIASNLIKAVFQIVEVLIFSIGLYCTKGLIQQIKKPYRYGVVIVLFYIVIKLIIEKYLATFGSAYLLVPLFYLAIKQYKNILKLPFINLIFLFTLFSEPFVGAAGSNAPVLVNAVYFSAFFVLIIFYLLSLEFDFKKTFKFKLALILLILLISLPSLNSYIYHSFHQVPLFEQNIKLSFLDENKDLQVDKNTYDYIKGLHDVLSEYTDTPVIGLYKLSGVIYLLGKNSPGSVSYDRTSTPLFCENLQYSKMNLKNTVVLSRDKIPSTMIECLKANGIDFQTYKFIPFEGKPPESYPLINIYLPN